MSTDRGILEEERDSLKRQLRQHYKNLARLEERAAKYTIDVPISVLNEIDEIKERIERDKARLEEVLTELEQAPPEEPEEQAKEGMAERSADLIRPGIGKKRISRRAALLAALGLLVLGVVVLVLRLSLVTPTSDDSVQVGIASFAGCPQVSKALSDATAPEPGKVTFKSLDEIQDSATARAHTEFDLVIWGQCSQANELTMHLEILTAHGPEEVIELESITAQTLALDPDRAARLGRAVINYLRGDHGEAASSLATLQQEASTPSEQAALAFLQANSLLFDKRYEEAITAYDSALEYGPIQAQAYNNRGVAGMNWALQLSWWDDQPSDAELQTAIDDLTTAIEAGEGTRAAVLAYFNRGMARSLVAGDNYDQALTDCEQAITQAPEQALGYVCQAAAHLMPSLEEATCSLRGIGFAREALAEAHDRDPNLADTFFWRGYLAFLQAEECDTAEQDKQKHSQDAQDDFQVFLELANQQPVRLAIDRYMLEVCPSLAQSP